MRSAPTARRPVVDLSGNTLEETIEMLASPHRRKVAMRKLMAAGRTGTPVVRAGLKHKDPDVRIACCKVLDHFMDEAAVPELIANLDHRHPGVRSWAIHALACDRCKEGVCRPGEEDVIPIVAEALLHDEDRQVRQQAAGLLGPSVLRSEAAKTAIAHAHKHDPHPAVRKIAGWWVPGGVRYRKLRV
ncbi:MAG: HEAT repeat domain-containing protein [Gammaproteobacteria bacterium]|nr:HEAT repeat domain-containing protein [Gammaproteobacteria bacterium]